MGVVGLNAFLKRENQTRLINIQEEVHKWKRANRDQTPIIVIDFLNLTSSHLNTKVDSICGGRHEIVLTMWRKKLDALKATGCSLVFFSDLGVQAGKVDEWLKRRNAEFNGFTKIYDLIDEEITLEEVQGKSSRYVLTSMFYGMAAVAREYGQFHHSIRRECDLDIAIFARNINALAVISTDTDFLIFDGNWRLWSAQDIHITRRTDQLKTIEFNRNGIARICSLAKHQLPLFATLLGNDFTNSYIKQLHEYFGPSEYRIENVARYVRKYGSDNKINQFTIKRISEQVFGYTNDELQQLLRQSLDSYNIDCSPVQIDDPLEQKLLHTALYPTYSARIYDIHSITISFYDMRGSDINFTMILIDWIKRKKGILKQNSNDTFLLLAKKDINDQFRAHTETMIHPDFPLPSLEELYVGSEDDAKVIETKWKLLAWIMSLSEDVISRIRNLPRDFLMISTTLYVLVKNGLIAAEAADGILYTESMVIANATSNVNYPSVVVSKYVRAAHLYNITFGHIRQNFATAGLLPYVQDLLRFDGVHFQKVMEQAAKMNTMELGSFFKPIDGYRIYANDN